MAAIFLLPYGSSLSVPYTVLGLPSQQALLPFIAHGHGAVCTVWGYGFSNVGQGKVISALCPSLRPLHMLHLNINNLSILSVHTAIFCLVKWDGTCPGVAGKGGFAT